MNLRTRVLCMLVAIPTAVGCATTIHVTSEHKILEEEVARLPPARPVPFSVTIEIKAPVIAAGRKPGRVGEPRNLVLNYPPYQFLNDTAHICAKRWFTNPHAISKEHSISIQELDLVYDEYTDVFAWRSAIRVDLNIQAMRGSKVYFNKNYSSGEIKGDWKRKTTERQEQYTRMIYRALLVTLDKAMAELSEK